MFHHIQTVTLLVLLDINWDFGAFRRVCEFTDAPVIICVDYKCNYSAYQDLILSSLFFSFCRVLCLQSAHLLGFLSFSVAPVEP